MKKFLTVVLMGMFLTAFTPLLIASEMDKGSGMEKGSMADKGSLMDPEVVEESEPVIEESEPVVEEVTVISAKVFMEATQEGSEISGTLDLIETGGGVTVVVSLSNVPTSGKHGIHVHAKGSCEDSGKAAGGHFNPASTKHGLLARDGHDNAHTGDMGNITIDENGDGALVIFLPGISLSEGEKNIAGKAVILHQKEDDFGQPTGNAGARVGCGIINLNS